LQFLNLVK